MKLNRGGDQRCRSRNFLKSGLKIRSQIQNKSFRIHNPAFNFFLIFKYRLWQKLSKTKMRLLSPWRTAGEWVRAGHLCATTMTRVVRGVDILFEFLHAELEIFEIWRKAVLPEIKSSREYFYTYRFFFFPRAGFGQIKTFLGGDKSKIVVEFRFNFLWGKQWC